MPATLEEILAQLTSKFPSVAKAARPEDEIKPYATFTVPASDLLAVATWLRDAAGFALLDMVTAVDWKGPTSVEGYIEDPNPNPYVPKGAYSHEKILPKANAKVQYADVFRLAYLFTNLEARGKLALKVEVPRGEPTVPTLSGLYKTADWQERESYDLMGIRFEGHPNLAKLLTPEFLQGHPLRKDYVHQKDYLD